VKRVKVYQTSDHKMEVNEVDFEEAKRMIAEAKAKRGDLL